MLELDCDVEMVFWNLAVLSDCNQKYNNTLSQIEGVFAECN